MPFLGLFVKLCHRTSLNSNALGQYLYFTLRDDFVNERETETVASKETFFLAFLLSVGVRV